MSDTALDSARKAALAEAERSERKARMFLTAASVMEGAVFLAIIFVIDWNDPTHLLIFLCACLVYGPIAFGMFALRSYIDVSTQRVLAGIRFGQEQ